MATALFINRTDLVKNTIIDGNVDTDLFIQYVKISQEIHIQNYLGGSLYKKIQDLIVDGEIDDIGNADYKALLDDFVLRISIIEDLLEKVIEVDPKRIEQVKEKLRKAIAELETNIDQNRFEQELIFYIEKLDITEEKVRLKNHLEYFKKELDGQFSNGKKLGFISQEIGREINTIVSKANFAEMKKLVVQMKDELEKIKEQLLNAL